MIFPEFLNKSSNSLTFPSFPWPISPPDFQVFSDFQVTGHPEVLACICDDATPNWTFFLLHARENSENISNNEVFYWVVNRVDFQWKVYFSSNPPHLIKMLRKNNENSHGHHNTQNLIVKYSCLVLALLTLIFIL